MPPGSKWIASYAKKKELSSKRKVGRHLSNESSMRKRDSHMMKGLHKKTCQQSRTRALLIIFMFYLIFCSSLSSSNESNLSVLCFGFSLINFPKFLWRLYIPTHLKFSIYQKFWWACDVFFSLTFYRLLLNF